MLEYEDMLRAGGGGGGSGYRSHGHQTAANTGYHDEVGRKEKYKYKSLCGRIT
jgi:hypothetical protein